MKKLLLIPITIILYYSSIAQKPANKQVTESNVNFSEFNYLNRPYAAFIRSPNTGYSFSDSSNQIAEGTLNHTYNILNDCDSVLIQFTLNMATCKSATVYVNNLLGFQKVYMTTGYKQLYVKGETIPENIDFHYSLVVPNSQKQHNKSILQIAISFHSMPHTGGNCTVSGLKIIDIINNHSTANSKQPQDNTENTNGNSKLKKTLADTDKFWVHLPYDSSWTYHYEFRTVINSVINKGVQGRWSTPDVSGGSGWQFYLKKDKNGNLLSFEEFDEQGEDQHYKVMTQDEISKYASGLRPPSGFIIVMSSSYRAFNQVYGHTKIALFNYSFNKFTLLFPFDDFSGDRCFVFYN